MTRHLSRFGLAGILLLPSLALAHTGTGDPHLHSALASGLLHPFTGLDHLAAMLALGVWSALAVRPLWLAPAAFVLMLAVGALAGFAGLAVPAVEPMIASSLLVLGLLVATRRGLPMALAAALAGLFAFFHGAAHGSELAADFGGTNQWLALAGMVCATAALHGLGIALGNTLFARLRWLGTAAGGGVALLGSALLLRLA
jgi:urease accessory protein